MKEKEKIVREIYRALDYANKSFAERVKPLIECFHQATFYEKSEEASAVLESMTDGIRKAIDRFNNEISKAVSNFAEELANAFKLQEQLRRKVRCECQIEDKAIRQLIENKSFIIDQEKIRLVCNKCRRCFKQKSIVAALDADRISDFKQLGVQFKPLTCDTCKERKGATLPCKCTICTKCICREAAVRMKALSKRKKQETIAFDCPRCGTQMSLETAYGAVENKEHLFNVLRVASLWSLRKKNAELCCMECFRNFDAREDKSACEHKVYCESCYSYICF